MTRSTHPFSFGASAGAIVAAAVNLVPCGLTYGAYATDGYEVVGYPFAFRRLGGFVPKHEFRTGWLLADAAIALGGLVGWAWLTLSRGSRRSWRRFPVVARAAGRGTAD